MDFCIEVLGKKVRLISFLNLGVKTPNLRCITVAYRTMFESNKILPFTCTFQMTSDLVIFEDLGG